VRVLVETTVQPGGWKITYKDPDTGAELAPARTVNRCPAPHDRFPLSPAHDLAVCTAEAHAACTDCTGAAISALYQSINQLDVPVGDIDKYGGYLFHCLLGDAWAELAGRAAAGEGIELEILIQPTDRDFSVLWWEMMFVGKDALAVQQTRKVAITRVIPTTNPLAQPQPLQLPLKVLFIVGREIDNALRPGAELFGILNRVPVPNATYTHFETVQLHVRLIPNAAWDEIQSTCAAFRPDVVHIVSHGVPDPASGDARLLLTDRAPKDPGAPEKRPEKTTDPYPCSAQRLLNLVTVQGVAPTVMIVNACHTADYQGAADLAFTAQLVQGGVAVALGMSGEVADRACQVFTLSFYQALLRGVPVSLAAAQGRRAALLDFPESMHNVEWARPTLFQAQGIKPTLGMNPAIRDFSAIAGSYRTLPPSALCGRLDCMNRYEAFRSSLPAPARPALFAFVTKETELGLGKTRLLEEIAARSIFDNFIPVLVRHDKENPDAPQNYLDVALQISVAVERTRQHFGFTAKALTMTRNYAYSQSPNPHPTPEDFVAFLSQETDLDRFLREQASGRLAAIDINRVVLPLIRAECKALRDELALAGQPPPTVLLLLDDLHRYANCDVILALIKEHGLGTPELPLPVVFTLYAAGQGKVLEEALRKMPDVPVVTLSAFQSGVDQRLVCRQFLLSHFKATVSSRSNKADDVEGFYDSIQEETNGRPGDFWKPEVKAVVNAHRRIKTLVPTNFEEMLTRWN
jgi:hypothetical protein